MFNMLIARMGDTFSRIMENREVNAVRSKLELMGDLVSTMRETDRVETKEPFFFMVKPIVDDDDDEENEWEGTIKSMTRIVGKSNYVLGKKMDLNTERLYTLV